MRLTLALILSATFSPVVAQTQCDTRETVLALLSDRYGETRRAIGIAGGSSLMELFASDATGTWTITMVLPDGQMCMMASGDAFEAHMEPPGDDS